MTSSSELLQITFDEALGRFQDGSSDLLHIDGCHRYDAARHDFDSWQPKLSQRSAVLLHDTTRRLDDFAVWRLAEELLRLAALQDDNLAVVRSLFATLGAGARRAGELQRSGGEGERLREANLRLEETTTCVDERPARVEAVTDPLARSRMLRIARFVRRRSWHGP